MSANFNTLSVDFSRGGIGILTLSRPNSANALSRQMGEDIAQFFSSLPLGVRVVIITGSGDRAFCAGADLKERRGMDQAQWQAQHHAFEEAAASLRACEVPVIAAVNGAAFGGGLELALAADFIYAAHTARFALTETTLGIIPGMGGTQSLPRSIGMAKAKELIFTGKAFTAQEAWDLGMVAKLCDDVMAEALATADAIAANAPLAMIAAKKAIKEGANVPLGAALQIELKYYNGLLESKDRQEGINAFNEKRKPSFSGS